MSARTLWMVGPVVLVLLVALASLVRDTGERPDASQVHRHRSASLRVLEAARHEADERIVVSPSKQPADLPPPGLPAWSPALLHGFDRELPTP